MGCGKLLVDKCALLKENLLHHAVRFIMVVERKSGEIPALPRNGNTAVKRRLDRSTHMIFYSKELISSREGKHNSISLVIFWRRFFYSLREFFVFCSV